MTNELSHTPDPEGCSVSDAATILLRKRDGIAVNPMPEATDPKGAAGAAKSQLHLIPPVAMTHLAAALADGASRYGAWNWRGTRIMSSTYISAMMRHIDAYRSGEELTTDSKVHHLGAIMANCAILLDAMEHGCLEDDRPKKPEKKKMSSEEIARAMGVGS